MSLAMFQRAMVELTLAPEKARLLRAGNTAVLAGFELTARERERLIAVAGQAGISVSCSLARGNRLEMIFQSYPMTCVLLRPALRSLVDELWQQSRPSNYQLRGEDIAFVELVQRKIHAGQLSLPYVDEVLAYELACMELTRRARQKGVAEVRAEGDPEAQTIVSFKHSPDALLPPLSRLKMPPADLPESPCLASVRLHEGRFEVQVLNEA